MKYLYIDPNLAELQRANQTTSVFRTIVRKTQQTTIKHFTKYIKNETFSQYILKIKYLYIGPNLVEPQRANQTTPVFRTILRKTLQTTIKQYILIFFSIT